jgi:hypothetical protein
VVDRELGRSAWMQTRANPRRGALELLDTLLQDQEA